MASRTSRASGPTSLPASRRAPRLFGGRRGRAAIAVGIAALTAIAVVPGSASAAPRPSLHAVQVKVDKLNAEAGAAAERYNDARVRLADANRRLTVVKHRLASKQAAVDAMQSAIGQVAAASYKSGGIDPTVEILLAKDPETMLNAAATMGQLSRHQAETLRKVVAARQAMKAARNDVVQQRAQASAITKQIAEEKSAVEAKLAEAKQLLGTLQAKQRAQLVRAQAAVASRGRAVASRARQGDIPKYDGPPSGRASVAVKTAYAQLGDPYSYGAAGPSAFDCSGLTMYAWGAAGVSLPHSSSAQYSSARRVSLSDLQPGDLVFYYSPISHVGIYVGGGRIIHAPHPGRSVEIAGLHTMPLVGAARP